MIIVSLRGRPATWARTAMLRLHLNEDREQTPADRLRTLRERAQSSQTSRS
jgi:cation/acetate symporter